MVTLSILTICGFVGILCAINPNILKFFANKLTGGKYANNKRVIEEFLRMFEEFSDQFSLKNGYIRFPKESPKITFVKDNDVWKYILPDGDMKLIDPYYTSRFNKIENALLTRQDMGAIKRILSDERLMITCL